MDKRKRGRQVKRAPLTIEQNLPVDPPQSYMRPIEDEEIVARQVEEAVQSLVTKQVDDAMLNKNMDEMVDKLIEIPVVATPRDIINYKVKELSRDIEELEPESEAWCNMLQEIGDLKRKLDKLE